MSDTNEEILTGRESVEKSQGFLPRLPDPVAQAESASIDQAVTDYQERTNIAGREAIDEVTFHHADGKPVDERVPLDAEVAARGLADWRAQKDAVQKQLAEKAFSDQVEQLKSPLRTLAQEAANLQWERSDAEIADLPEAERVAYLAERQRLADLEQQRQQAAQQQQTQPEQQIPGVDPDIARHLEDPKLLAAIQQQRQQDFQQASQATQAAVQSIHDAAKIATSVILNDFPEMQHLVAMTPAQQEAAMQTLRQSNPERFAALQQKIDGVRNVIDASTRTYQQQFQQEQAQFQNWAKSQDEAWSSEISKEPPQRQAAIRQEAAQMLRDHGLTDQQINNEWNTNALLRSAAGQRVLADAAAWRISQKAARTMKPTYAVPKVQRPGSPVERIPEADSDLRALSNRLQGAKGNDALRLAAQLVAQRRMRSR